MAIQQINKSIQEVKRIKMTDNTKDMDPLERRAAAERSFLSQGLITEDEQIIECVLREQGRGIIKLDCKDMAFIVMSSRLIDMAARQGNIADWRDNRGKTLVHYTFRATGQELDKLISYGCDLNAQDNEGNTPLHDFVAIEGDEIYRMLLKRGAALNIKNNRGETPIDIAAVKHAKRTYIDLSRARDHGAFISEDSLIQACCNNDVNFMADFFLEPNERKEFGRKDDLIGRRVKYDYEQGWRPEECADFLLMYAVRNNACDVIKILLKKADPCIIDENDYSLFQWAVSEGHLDTVKVLLNDKRTDINYAGNNDFSPLKYAICTGKTEIAKLLLNDERIQISDKAFLLRCSEKYPDIMKLLEKIEETPQKECKVHRSVRKHTMCLDESLVKRLDNEKTNIERQSSVKISHQNGTHVQYDNFRDR